MQAAARLRPQVAQRGQVRRQAVFRQVEERRLAAYVLRGCSKELLALPRVCKSRGSLPAQQALVGVSLLFGSM